jgi:hypothetical protein
MIPNINMNKLNEWADNQFELGIKAERKRVLDWINNNRTYIELEAGIGVYDNNFTADELIEFIESEI